MDDEDFESVNAFKWRADKNRRNLRVARSAPRDANGLQKKLYLHHFLLPGVPKVDHRDGNGLNNQRHNLRPATARQNKQAFQHKQIGTSSSYRGVYWHKQHKTWTAQITVDGVQKCLGSFEVEKEAALAYDTAAKEHFGVFASPNFP